MKDWANLAIAVVNLTTAVTLLIKATKEPNKKGTTKRSHGGKRK